MISCHECHKEVKKGEPFCSFYAWIFHLDCFLVYVKVHLRKSKQNNDHEQDGA